MTRRNDGRWQESVTIDGKRHFFYGHTKTEVLQKIRDFEVKSETGMSFRETAEKWWAEHEPKLAYNTIKPYKPALRRAIEEFGDDPIKSITSHDVAKFIRSFEKLGRADKTCRTQLMIISLVFQYAVSEGYAPANVCRDLSVSDNLPKEKRAMPSADDIARVKNSTSCYFGMLAYWALYTGLRRGELLALAWDDVDLDARTIRVNKSLFYLDGKPTIKLPKTETSIGTVPILDKLAEKIKPGKGLVFPNLQGTYLGPMQFQRSWDRYKRESGVSATLHQFRHAYATMLYEAGVPPEDMQILLRHAQLSTTMDIYTDIRDSHVKKVHEKVYKVDIG